MPRILVHIADVAAYVPPGSALDLDAEDRATSAYLPGRVDPMLPPELSNGVCSLVAGRRPAGAHGHARPGRCAGRFAAR